MATIEVAGELKMNPDGKKVTRVPLKVQGELAFDEVGERTNSLPKQLAVVRVYEQAKAKITIGDTNYDTILPDDRRLVAVTKSDTESIIFSPQGPLTREHSELLEAPCGRLTLDELLPGKSVALNNTWGVDETVLKRLLNLDSVSQSSVKAVVKEIKGSVAQVQMEGEITGVVAGMTAEIELKAKYNFDNSLKQITWLGLAIREDRAVGHAEPGFETITKIAIRSNPVELPPMLSAAELAKMNFDVNASTSLLKFEAAKAGFGLLVDRKWRVLTDRHDLTVMRLVENGELVAQCNISILPDLPAGKQVSLEELQSDIKQSLDSHFSQFLEAGQSVTENGLRVLRVVAIGQASELPIHWVYYLISNEQGRRAAFVFTLEAKLVEGFGAADRVLTSTFQFADRPSSTSPETAAPALTPPAKDAETAAKPGAPAAR